MCTCPVECVTYHSPDCETITPLKHAFQQKCQTFCSSPRISCPLALGGSADGSTPQPTTAHNRTTHLTRASLPRNKQIRTHSRTKWHTKRGQANGAAGRGRRSRDRSWHCPPQIKLARLPFAVLKHSPRKTKSYRSRGFGASWSFSSLGAELNSPSIRPAGTTTSCLPSIWTPSSRRQISTPWQCRIIGQRKDG